jgi:DNA-binding XRE family transcriptional regulator
MIHSTEKSMNIHSVSGKSFKVGHSARGSYTSACRLGMLMKPSEFKAWRKLMKMTQKDAASALGLKSRIIQYYEKGERNGEKFAIPKAIELACYALTLGVESYSGPETDKKKANKE